MKNVTRNGLVAALAVAAGCACTLLVQPPAAIAGQTMNHGQMAVTVGDLTISGVAARFLLEGRPGAVFLTIDNKGEADRIVAASSPLTDRVELHTHTMNDGVMKMRRIEGIDVAANAKTELKSGGLHIMMFGVKPLPEKGSMVPLTLTFEKAGKVDLKAMVSKKAGMSH